MFAIRYCCDTRNLEYDYKIFETVGAACQWWLNRVGPVSTRFYSMLYVVPPGIEDPVKWCKDNIKEVVNA